MSRQLVIEITHKSGWQRLYYIGFFVAIMSMVSSTALPFYGLWVVALITILLCFFAVIKSRNQLLHITGSNLDNVNSYWQLLSQGRHQPILWQATLLKSQSFPHCVQLVFDTQQPMIKRETVVIWKDQVEADTWRQLKVLTRWA